MFWLKLIYFKRTRIISACQLAISPNTIVNRAREAKISPMALWGSPSLRLAKRPSGVKAHPARLELQTLKEYLKKMERTSRTMRVCARAAVDPALRLTKVIVYRFRRVAVKAPQRTMTIIQSNKILEKTTMMKKCLILCSFNRRWHRQLWLSATNSTRLRDLSLQKNLKWRIETTHAAMMKNGTTTMMIKIREFLKTWRKWVFIWRVRTPSS